MKYTAPLIILLTAQIAAFGQSDEWISWQTHNNVEDVAFDCEFTWVTTGYAIISYHQNTGDQHFFSETNTDVRGYIDEIEVDQNGTKWILTTTGLYFLKNNLITKIESSIIDSALSESNHLYNLKVDGNGYIWFSNYKNIIYKYNPISNQCTVFTLSESNNKLLLATNDIGNLYALVLNKSVGYILYTLNEKITQVALLEQLPFISIYPNSFVIDNENNFWIIIGAEVSYGKDDFLISDGGILVYTNEKWNIFDPQQLTPGQKIAGYINTFKLQSGGIVLEAQSPNSFLSTQETYKTTFNKQTNTLNFEIFSPLFISHNIEGLDFEDNLYYSNLDLIKFNSNGLRDTIQLSQVEQEICDDIYIGNNNAFWLYTYDKLSLLKEGQFTNFEDKINTVTTGRLLNVLCDSINTWFIFPDVIIKFDEVSWQYFSLSEFGLNEFISKIQHAQIDYEGKFWVLGDDLLLKQNDIDWEIINQFDGADHYYHNFILSDSIAYIVGKDSLYVFDQNSWQVKAWGTDNLPEMEDINHSIMGEDGSIYLSVGDSVYLISGAVASSLLHVGTRVFTYNNNTHILSWVWGDSLFQLDQISGITTSKMLPHYPYYQTIGADNLGNILFFAYYQNPVLMFNPNGIIDYTDDYLDIPDIPLSNCGYYINAMLDLEIKVFPNPAANYIDILLNLTNSGDLNINVYDITGKLMLNDFKSEVENGPLYLNYDVSNFTPGIYFIQIAGNNQTTTKSFIRI